MSERNGQYFVVEGTDGSGSSTQIRDTIIPWFESMGYEYGSPEVINGTAIGPDLVTTREPGGTKIGEEHRLTLLHNKDVSLTPDEEFNLFTDQRRQLSLKIVEPQLGLGKRVVSERSFISSYAYQGHGLGIDREDIVRITKDAISPTMFQPDVPILIHVTPDEARKRMENAGVSADKIESRDEDFFERVYEGYMEAAERFNMEVIDGSPELDVVSRAIIQVLSDRLEA